MSGKRKFWARLLGFYESIVSFVCRPTTFDEYRVLKSIVSTALRCQHEIESSTYSYEFIAAWYSCGTFVIQSYRSPYWRYDSDDGKSNNKQGFSRPTKYQLGSSRATLLRRLNKSVHECLGLAEKDNLVQGGLGHEEV